MKDFKVRRDFIQSPSFDLIPEELHGHQKKLRFIWGCIERYRCENGLNHNQVRILEVGCSNGRNLAMPLAESGYQVTGIDLHLESIQYAQSHSAFSNTRFLCQDLSDLCEDERFEIVLLSDILEHVDDPADICMTAIQHLVKNGLVLISIPNGYGLYELEQRIIRMAHLNPMIDFVRNVINRLLGRKIVGPAYNFDSGHIQFFHLRDFELLLNRVGLETLERGNGALMGGTLSYALLNKIPFIVRFTLKMADIIPQRWVSTWYFCTRVRKTDM